MTSDYTFEINSASVNPTGKWNFEFRRNTGQIFWRVFINGEFIFQGDDYDTIMGMSDCDVLDFEIFCNEESVWTGEFKHPYGWASIDEDKCLIKGTPDLVDEYTCIMNNYETKYWLFLALGGTQPDLYDCTPAFLMNINNFGYLMTDYIDLLLGINNMDCGLTVTSSFILRDNFPNGDNYAAAYGANNYVTGAANRLEYIYMWKNTAIRTVMGGTGCNDYDLTSFKDFEEMLRTFFNAYWYIDENGDFRIEHISFFLPGFAHSSFGTSTIDLTALIAPQTGKSFAYRRNKYELLADRLFDQEVWKMQHYSDTEGTITHQNDFEGVPIFYGAAAGAKSDCVPGIFKEKEWNAPKFWTDIYWAYQLSGAGTPDTINCPGWLMMDIDTTPTPDQVRCETGALSGVSRINGHLSIANLQDHYHTWDRIFITGDMNSGAVTVFDSEIRKKLQIPISFPICCLGNFDPIAGITTEMGIGLLNSAEIDQKSITVQLEYD